MARKRIDLFKYNFQYKMNRGQFYDIQHDVESFNQTHKILNIMNLQSPKEFYLLDVYSDATEYGGLSEVELKQNQEEGSVRVRTKFVRENQGF